MVDDPDEVERHKASVIGHLTELISRTKVALYYLTAGMVAAYLLAPKVVNVLAIPLYKVLENVPGIDLKKTLVIIDPFEKVWVQLRISFVLGLFISLPLILWQVGKFVGPGLYTTERRRIKSFLYTSYIIFVGGLFLGYYVSLPIVLNALLKFGGMDQVALLSLSRYINATIGILIASGLLMEIPIGIFFASAWGWVPVKTWASGRRMAVIANAVISAILAPPDVMSMILLMIPIQLLYEGGILAARVAEWKRARSSK